MPGKKEVEEVLEVVKLSAALAKTREPMVRHEVVDITTNRIRDSLDTFVSMFIDSCRKRTPLRMYYATLESSKVRSYDDEEIELIVRVKIGVDVPEELDSIVHDLQDRPMAITV